MNPFHITYIGHATNLIELDGVRLLTDPLLRDRVMHLRRDSQTFIDETVYQNIDAVIISHMHYDHLDLPSLALLGSQTRLIVPRGMGRMLRRQGYRYIEELTERDTTTVGPLTVRATFADHDRARFRYGPTADCLGFVIEGSHSLYFPGDTDLFPEMSRLSEQLDVALLPVWGWGPTLGKGHLDPYRAAQAVQLLQPRLAIPIHWGTFYPWGIGWLKPDFLFNPPHSFAQHAARLAPNVDVQILVPGQTVQVPQVVSLT